ncbi:MAG: hypothetical protein U1E65_03795 [Myxococcota bacterium]
MRQWLDSAVGLPVWSASAGPGPSYALSLELGEQVRRPVRLSNPSLSFVKRTFEGSHSLIVECPWRLLEGDRLLWSAFAAFDPKSGFGGELAALQGHLLEGIEVVGPMCDLELRFSGDLTLSAFALETRQKPPRINWSFASPLGAVSVGPGPRLQLTPKAQQKAEARRRLVALSGDDDTIPALRARLKKGATPEEIEAEIADPVPLYPEDSGKKKPKKAAKKRTSKKKAPKR